MLIPPVYGLQARPPIGYGPPFNIPVNTSSILPDGSLTTRPHRCSLPEMLDLMVLRDRQALPPPGFPGWCVLDIFFFFFLLIFLFAFPRLFFSFSRDRLLLFLFLHVLLLNRFLN